MSRPRRLARALPLGPARPRATATAAPAQVFIASKPHPDFWIAPLLITANIAPKDVAGRHPGALMLQVSFSVAPPPARDPAEIAQDIYLLWPAQLVGTDGADGADPALVRQVEGAGLQGAGARARLRTRRAAGPRWAPGRARRGGATWARRRS